MKEVPRMCFELEMIGERIISDLINENCKFLLDLSVRSLETS
jgi:hypothetical protein